MDAFVDDIVEMAKRLRALGKDVGIDTLPGLPHGFLNFIQVFEIFSFSEYQNQKRDSKNKHFALLFEIT